MSTVSGADNFIANPYQCDVDASSLLTDAVDLNTNYIYVFYTHHNNLARASSKSSVDAHNENRT